MPLLQYAYWATKLLVFGLIKSLGPPQHEDVPSVVRDLLAEMPEAGANNFHLHKGRNAFEYSRPLMARNAVPSETQSDKWKAGIHIH